MKFIKLKKIMAVVVASACLLSAMPAGTVFGAPVATDYVNIAEGCSYELGYIPNSSYKDSGGELTDGLIGGLSIYDGPWVGVDNLYSADVVIDLGEERSFRGVEAFYLCGPSGVRKPENLIVLYSNDKESWTEFLETKNPAGSHPDAHDDIETIYLESDTPVTARYVKCKTTRASGKGWIFISEIKIMGDVLSTPKTPVITEGEYNDSNLYVREGESFTLEISAETGDIGELSYQWYENDVPVGTDSPELTIENVSLSDSGKAYWCIVTNTLNDMTATERSKMIMISVVNASLNAEYAQFAVDLPEKTSIVAGEDLVLSVDAFVNDGGTLSYQWYKEGEKLGTNSRTLTVPRVALEDSGEYYVIVTSKNNNIKRRVTSTVCEVEVTPYYGENLIGNVVYDTGLSADEYHPDYKDNLHTKLTDGVKTDSIESSDNVGIGGEYGAADLTFVMDEVKKMSEIHFSAYNDADKGISAPGFLQIYAYMDYQWVTIYKSTLETENDKDNFILTFENPINTSALRFSFSNYDEWLVVDEITVYEDKTGLTPTDYLKVANNNNIALGLPYERSRKTGGSYTDKNDAEITDGNLGSTHYSNACWQAFTGVPDVVFTFDLGYGSSFEEVAVTTTQDKGSGIRLAGGFKIEVSEDKENWEEVGTAKIPAQTANSVMTTHHHTLPKTAKGRYARITVTKGESSSWIFLSEIQILEKSADNLGLESNNISYGKSYTVSNEASLDKPDNAKLLKLTDGHSFATDEISSTWVGFEGDTEIVMNLGTSYTFEQVAARFNKNNLPDSVKVWTSPDNTTWNFSGEKDITGENFDVVFDTPVTAAYVKFEIASDSYFMVDEIKAFEIQSVFPEQAPEEFYKDTNNLALDKEYTVSVGAEASYPDKGGKELTDGIRGTYLYSNDAWSAYSVAENEKVSVTIDLGAVKTFEQIQVGMFESSTTSLKIEYPYELLIECSDDGDSWSVYADDIVKYYEGSGIKRDNYLKSGSGRYVRFTFIPNGLLFLDEIAIFENLVDGIDYELNPDKGASLNIVRGKSYVVSRAADYREVAGLLTDGLYGNTGSNFDKNWTGFKRSNSMANNIELIFDLDGAHSVTDVIVGSRNNQSKKVKTPENLKIWASDDGSSWLKLTDVADNDTQGAVTLAWSGARDGVADNTDYDMVYAKHIKVTFDTPADKSYYAYLDEIEVIGKRGKCSAAMDIVVDGAEYNLAAGRSYVISPKHINDQHDIDYKQLTDGILGTKDPADPAWVLFKELDSLTGIETDGAIIQSVTIPLCDEGEDGKYVTSVETHFLSTGFGTTTEYPWNVWTYVSNDGENWWRLSDKDWNVNSRVWNSGIITSGWQCNRTYGRDIITAPAIKAKYVRVDFELLRNNMMDEIIVKGYDSEVAGYIEIDENETRRIGDPALIHDPTSFGYFDENGEIVHYYQTAGESTAYIQDMVLCYNGWVRLDEETQTYKEHWKADWFRPYLTYVGTDGEVKDVMYDTVCFLALYARGGRSFCNVVGPAYEPIQFGDWQWYMNKLFGEGGDVDELNKAAKRASEELGDPNYKVKLQIMHPGVDDSKTPTHFGPIDGKYYNLKETADWQFACDWWFDAVLDGMFTDEAHTIPRWEYIDFSGFYWFNEQLGYHSEYILYNTQKCHELGYKMSWIPFNYANGNLWPQDLGLDMVALQPNHFFGNGFEPGTQATVGNDWLDLVAYNANYAQIGLEMEFDGRLWEDPVKYNQFLDYLNGVKKNGMDGDKCYRNWYTAGLNLLETATSDLKQVRDIYDYCYQIMQGTYEYQEHIEYFSGELIDNKTYDTNIGQAAAGGGVYYDDSKKEPVETATPSDEGYVWFTGTNGYQLKDSNGEFVKGWAEVNGDWYYLDANGYMKTGWVKDGNTWYYLKSNGIMVDTGWFMVDNVWYYFGGTGAMKKGWISDNGRWYYMMSSGSMASGKWVQVNGNWYYFLGNGAMATGWVLDGNNWYYLSESGAMATGWKAVKGEWYYLDPANGKMAKNTTVDGYKLGADGTWVK